MSQNKNRRASAQMSSYATLADFCRIFHEETDRLYTLGFLLTADHELTERSFLAAFEDCAEGVSVFKNCASAWATRAVIKSALKTVRREDKRVSVRIRVASEGSVPVGLQLAQAITGLQASERFAYVLTVLERYSDRECSVLLDSTVAEVIHRRNLALQQIAAALMASECAASTRSSSPLKHQSEAAR